MDRDRDDSDREGAPPAVATRRRLLRPGWLVLHVLLVVALVAMVRLGLWQWSRGEDTGSIRNYSYGLEWYAFALLSVVGWVKFCLDETAPAQPEGSAAGPAVPAARTGTAGNSAAAAGSPVPPPPAAPAVDPEDDPELAAWNARFAELARRDAERSRGAEQSR